MKTAKIISSSNAADPRPWFRLLVQDGVPTSVDMVEANGLTAFRDKMAETGRLPMSGQDRARLQQAEVAAARRVYPVALSNKPRPQGSPTPDADRPALKDEVHVLAMTVEGEIEFVPTTQQQSEYYAHLAWYDPKTSEWTVLEFEDEPVPEPDPDPNSLP